jgi:anti-sigma regulatory factor (Ser/Thr protein kinase)
VVVSAIYQPASEAMLVGGDWYLVAPLEDSGRVAMCVGDAVGHGLQAATVMGRLRAATAATALTDPDPASVVSTVDRYASTVPGARCATLAFAVVDTAEETVSYVCAGHPYPLVVTPTGGVQYLEDGRVPPLSARAGSECRPGRASLPAGSLLIMYTDGLIERHDESLSEGFEHLAATASACADLPVDQVCTTLLDQLTPTADHKDDVVILAMRPSGVTDTSFVATMPADLAHVTAARHGLRDWLAGVGVDERLEHDVVLCVGEALANAIEHGSGLDPDLSVSLEIFARASVIDVTVGDAGHWTDDSTSERRDSDRGRGLTLIRGLADQVDVVRRPYGTNVHLQFSRVPTAGGSDPRNEHADQEAHV